MQMSQKQWFELLKKEFKEDITIREGLRKILANELVIKLRLENPAQNKDELNNRWLLDLAEQAGNIRDYFKKQKIPFILCDSGDGIDMHIFTANLKEFYTQDKKKVMIMKMIIQQTIMVNAKVQKEISILFENLDKEEKVLAVGSLNEFTKSYKTVISNLKTKTYPNQSEVRYPSEIKKWKIPKSMMKKVQTELLKYDDAKHEVSAKSTASSLDLRDVVNEIKDRISITDISSDYGFNLDNKGSYYQGECKFHNSKGKNDFITYDDKNFYCFGCGAKGDVISFVMQAEKLGFIDAVKKLATRFNVPLKKYSSEELKEMERARQERQLLQNVLTDAAEFFHSQIDSVKIDGLSIREILNKERGFYDHTIHKYRIGYADTNNNVVEHLLKKYSREDLLLSGLFIPYEDKLFCLFKGRIVFPYLKNNEVVYMIARKTELTPKNKFEEAKYIKLRVYNDSRPYISKHLRNDHLFNTDSLGKDYVLITEGITDCISLDQAGFPCISPVTIRFRKRDLENLLKICKRLDKVYLINDNEANKMGTEGSIDTASYLFRNSIDQVRVCTIPLPQSMEKIDVNDFLSKSKDPNKDIQELINKSEHIIDFLIAQFSKDKVAKNKQIKEIFELIKHKDPILQEEFLKELSKKLDISFDTLKKSFDK